MRRQSRTTLYLFCALLTLATIYVITTHSVIRSTYSSDSLPSSDEESAGDNQESAGLKRKVPVNVIRLVTKCRDRSKELSIRERGDFLVFHNAIPARKDYLCHESVTLATQGDYTFLDNLERLTVRWKGPISVSLYAPGDDFQATLKAVAYMRQCQSELVRDYVTFHLFYDRRHYPKKPGPRIYDLITKYDDPIDCDSFKEPPYYRVKRADMYKTKHKLTYPINVARNVAVQESQTHYVLAADMELIPSVGIIDNFLNMIIADYDGWDTAEMLQVNSSSLREVYAIALMEVTSDSKVPATKTQLQEMHAAKKAFFFAEKLCIACQGIPDRKEWINASESEGFHIFSTAKRQGTYERWEPVYIGTRTDPLFDERVTWEGTTNKMIQAYVLCLLDYKFHVLDNAFFVHRPGIKMKSSQTVKDKKEMAELIKKTIVPELVSVYGKREGCVVGGEYTRTVGT